MDTMFDTNLRNGSGRSRKVRARKQTIGADGRNVIDNVREQSVKGK